jgi:two-component system, OmpR family, sensor kinase
MSLRVRLVAGLLALAAIGLLLLGGITYAVQRAFLYDRADQQARQAIFPVRHRLDDLGVGGLGIAPGRPPDAHGDNRGGGPEDVSLPPGTYGEARSATGTVLRRTVLAYGDRTPPRPDLPANVAPGTMRTVDAVGGDLRYRVYAAPSFGGETTIAAVPLHEVDSTLDRLLLVEGLVVAGILAALAIVASWLVRLGLRPLDRMGETAGTIATGDLSRRVETATPRTEVGRLGLALTRMLDRIEEAFAQRRRSEDRLRQFLADASHELRTPLSSIRGYAELFRIGAARDEKDVEKSMRRIEEEAARMGVLVEDLLALARLDQVRDQVRAEVDLAKAAEDAVDDARATAPDREIAFRADERAHVLGDPDQLRQVLGNLLRNALVHTPAGTPVEVAVRHEGESVAIEVRDHGPGLPAGDPDALFERFWRAEGGRVRGRAGAGLGLAIVAGIVRAHGGRVEAADAEGGGARFTVTLPAHGPAPAPTGVTHAGAGQA